MSDYFEKYQIRRLRSSYLSVIVSITVVLFMLGTLGVVGIKYRQGIAYLKNQITMTIFLKDSLRGNQIKNLKLFLAKKPAIKNVAFISKQEAIASYSKTLGADFLKILGTNPLKDAFDVRFKKSFVNSKQIEILKKELNENAFVYEVIYDKALVPLLNKNLKKISLWALGFIIFFGFISVVLINASIRLSMYSKRFIISTMQIVGATKSFIRKPFLIKSIQLGFIAALIANGLLLLGLYYLHVKIPYLQFFSDKESIMLICVSTWIIGILVSGLSTFFAVQKFLNLKTNQLYY